MAKKRPKNLVLIMSMRPEHYNDIREGHKTWELRSRIPKDYVGPVYIYVTKADPLLWIYERTFCNELPDGRYDQGVNYDVANGKVAAKFWFEEYEELGWHDDVFVRTKNMDMSTLLEKTMVNYNYLGKRFVKDGNVTGFAIHLDKFEEFAYPMELSEFFTYKMRLVDCGRDCPPYFDEVKTPIRKAPQSWMYAFTK